MSTGFDRQVGGDFLPDGNFKIDEPLGYFVQNGDLYLELCAWQRRMVALQVLHPDMPEYMVVGSPSKVTVLAGFVTDFNSIKFRLFWMFFSPWETKRPPIPHDAGYRTINWLRKKRVIQRSEHARWRKTFDLLFRESMNYSQPEIAGWKKRAAYRAVRIFGRFTWMEKQTPSIIKHRGARHTPNSRKPR
tara:strand:+ start:2238 stop:2804 length:567 start_codon:yes stop_codon:yes gene_type:complete